MSFPEVLTIYHTRVIRAKKRENGGLVEVEIGRPGY